MLHHPANNSVALPATLWESFGPQNLVFNQFDTSLGTLISVEIMMEGSLFTDLEVENLMIVPVTFLPSQFVNFSGFLNAAAPNMPAVAVSMTTTEVPTGDGEAAGVLAIHDGTTDFAGPSGFSAGINTEVDTDMQLIGAGFAPYEGLSTVNVPVTAITASGQLTSPSSPTLDLDWQAVLQATGEIWYTYEDNIIPVPEPSVYGAMGLLVCGGLGRLSTPPTQSKGCTGLT